MEYAGRLPRLSAANPNVKYPRNPPACVTSTHRADFTMEKCRSSCRYPGSHEYVNQYADMSNIARTSERMNMRL